jgi:hypothetical protein
MPLGTEGGSVSYRCPARKRRVRYVPYVSLEVRRTHKIIRYHGNVAEFLQPAILEAERRGPDAIVLAFYHTRRCGDPSGKFSCKGGCFAALGELEDLLLATASPGKAKIVKVGEE